MPQLRIFLEKPSILEGRGIIFSASVIVDNDCELNTVERFMKANFPPPWKWAVEKEKKVYDSISCQGGHPMG